MIPIIKLLTFVIIAMIFLRIAGRKSISQLTLSQTVIAFTVGSIFIQPFYDLTFWQIVSGSGALILILVVIEYLQTKSPMFERIVTGKSVLVIIDGKILYENLKSLRITVEQIEMGLREKGISSIAHVRTGTLEPNGNFGFELTKEMQPVTVRDLQHLVIDNDTTENIFDKVRKDAGYRE